MRFSGKAAIATGSISAIGRAVAILFAQEGAKVVVTGRNSGRLAEIETIINKGSGEGICYKHFSLTSL